jgi:hypothetical protein
MNINDYTADGFSKVCDVVHHSDRSDHWDYINVDRENCVNDHRSWLYFIVVGDQIVKCGETGNQLLIESKVGSPRWIKGTKSRLGRYMNGDSTCSTLRESLFDQVAQGIVSVWAKKLPIRRVKTTVRGRETIVEQSIHKDLEMVYLDHFVSEYGTLPSLNKSRK